MPWAEGLAVSISSKFNQKVVKAITLHRPWGYAIACLDKRHENRSWRCPLPIGSWLAIHNGQKWDEAAAEFIRRENSSELIDNPTPENDPPGAIIAMCRFLGNEESSDSPWFWGPYGWRLGDVTAIKPVPAKGQQGLWVVDDDTLEVVYDRLIRPKTYGNCWKCDRGYIVPGLDYALCPHDGWVANPWKKITPTKEQNAI
jgi:hypothetical protein